MATMATTKRRSLGRGLGALLGQPEPDDESEVVTKLHSDDEMQKLPVDLLQRGKYQPRIDMRPETLQELADSIKAQGVVQPIVVRPLDAAGRRGPHALRDHRRRAPLARRAARRPARDSGRRASRARRSRDRDGAHREHPAREPESARRSARAGSPDHRIRHDACDRRRSGRSLARCRVQSAALAGAHRRGEDARRASRAGDGSRARTARARDQAAASRSRRAGREEEVCRCARPRRWSSA